MNNENELKEMLQQRLANAREIRSLLDRKEYMKLEGRDSVLTRVTAEEKFLEKFTSANPQPLEKKFFETNNLIHLLNLVNEIPKQSGVVAVLKTFAIKNFDNESICKKTLFKGSNVDRLRVDIVANNGKEWIKVITRSVKGIVSDWFPSGSGKDIFTSAKEYLYMAATWNQVDLPKICFIFCAGITDKMAGKLERMGIEVKGKRFPQDEIKKLPADFEAELEEDDEIFVARRKEEKPLVNLDVSAVFVLISNLTHGGCEKKLITKLLMEQADEEKKTKAREYLLQEIGDKEMIICRTAYESVMQILETVAGAAEKERAKELFKNVRIVEDNVSERAERLEETERISGRCKIIFGTGDSYKAITASANKHCIKSAISQGVSFDVIIHPSRALSEKKEEGYIGPK